MNSTVVARSGDLVVTVDDIDARILRLPQSERPKPGQDLDQWYEHQISELVVETSLRGAAMAEKVDEDQTFLTARRQAEQHFGLQLCLARIRPDSELASPEELREFYESRAQTFAAPERRSAFHIFHRIISGESRAAARDAMEGIRDRVLQGDSFQRLASEYSDSETRHIGGSLSWLSRGQLPGGFDDVIFNLDEGVPSEVVETRDGLHIFFVDQILPARQLSFDEAQSIVQKQFLADRRQKVLAELEAAVELPTAAVVLDRKEFDVISKAGDSSAVVFRLGESELTLGDLQRQLNETLAQQDAPSPLPASDLGWKLLEQQRRREVVFFYCRENESIPDDQLESRLTSWQAQALVDLYRNRKLRKIALRDESRLHLFYESNIGLFSKPPKWRVRRLRVPLDDSARAVMARLEQAAAHDGSTLESLQAELGGGIETLDFSSLADLRRVQPKLPPLIAPLAVGELSPPYRSDEGLEIAEVVERQEAEPVPFADIRDYVAAAYVQQYTSELYQELITEILRDHPLEIEPDGIAALRASSSMQPDISVDQLEALFNEL